MSGVFSKVDLFGVFIFWDSVREGTEWKDVFFPMPLPQNNFFMKTNLIFMRQTDTSVFFFFSSSFSSPAFLTMFMFGFAAAFRKEEQPTESDEF